MLNSGICGVCSENHTKHINAPCGRNVEVFFFKYSLTHGNLTSYKLFAARTAPKKNKLCQCVVSTRRCHSAHCKRVNGHCSKHVSRAPHFPFRRRAVGPSLSRCFVWFFPLGVFEIACLSSQTPYVEWFEGSHPSTKFVRSIVSCWPMSWTILKKGLKTASKKTVGILPISFLKLNHLVWHFLSFNFVQINVNLLEKQLTTVYFKDVRFPWVTLYDLMVRKGTTGF